MLPNPEYIILNPYLALHCYSNSSYQKMWLKEVKSSLISVATIKAWPFLGGGKQCKDAIIHARTSRVKTIQCGSCRKHPQEWLPFTQREQNPHLRGWNPVVRSSAGFFYGRWESVRVGVFQRVKSQAGVITSGWGLHMWQEHEES